MKPKDETTRKLFQQMREDDERHTPSFALDWKAAQSRRKEPRRRRAAWPLATGAAAVSLAAAVVLMVVLKLPPRPAAIDPLVDGRRLEAFDMDGMSRLLVEQFRDPSAMSWRYPTDYLLKPELNPNFSGSRLELPSLPN